MSTLVRITGAQHEGLIVCPEHQREIAFDLAFEKLPEAEVKFWGQRCAMCGVDPSLGRSCENESCRSPLHPRWPAVYCCNACALDDL
jgi:hypothetical protein